MRGPLLIQAHEIDRWADTAPAKAALPDLIRRLVKATVPKENLLKVDFPAYAETHRSGYDGITVTARGTGHVPEGICFWELGCEKSARKKAQKDYNNRIEENRQRIQAGQGDDLSQAAYIAVTAHDWHPVGKPSPPQKSSASKHTKGKKSASSESMDDWAQARSKEGHFREVRAYDSNRLEQWLQEAQSVAIWFAQQELGKRVDGVLDIDSHWSCVRQTLCRPLPPELFLINRTGLASEFKTWLNAPAKQLLVKAPSAWEVAAVFAAWVQTLPDDEKEVIAARALIVEDRETWRNLADSPPHHPMILVAAPSLAGEEPELFAQAQLKGHHVLRFAEFRVPASSGAVNMERIRRHDLQQALEKAGLEEAEATQLATAAGGNLTILRRRFPHADYRPPLWANDSRLAPLSLTPAWSDENPSDKEIVQQIAGSSYADCRAVVAHWQAQEDAPVRLILQTWEFLSPPDAWEMLRHYHGPTHLDAFSKAAVDVLSEENPALSLPSDERPMAAIKGKVWKYSPALRQGLAEILALGAAREDESDTSINLGFSARAMMVVRQILLPGSGWQRWASLGGLLPLLAEAAPGEFLAAVERDLQTDSSQLVELMRQELSPTPWGGGAYHSGLLWALETVAWSGEQMPRAAFLLARLAELDPGGKWANRPSGSAARIFFSWRPQTMAPVGERIAVLKGLGRKMPDITWKIVLGLMPEFHQSFLDSAKPSYRDWAAGWEGTVTNDDYFGCINSVVELAITLAIEEPRRWLQLINHLGPLFFHAPAEYTRLKDNLAAFVQSESCGGIREEIWECLRKLVEDHTHFHDADWALPKSEVDRIAQLRDILRPDDLVIASVHWFDDGGLIDGDSTTTYEQKQERRAAKRREVIHAIWSTGGISDALRLAKLVMHAGTVGWSLAEAVGEEAQSAIIPSLLDCGEPALEAFASAYAGQRIQVNGSAWAMTLAQVGWTVKQLATWALQMPFTPETWGWLVSKGPEVERLYWEKAGSWGGADIDLPAAQYAIKQFQSRKRAWPSLDFLMTRQDMKHDVSAEMVCEALEAIMANPGEQQAGVMEGHHVHKAFKLLHASVDVDEGRMARLEFAFLAFLDRFSPVLPKTLQRTLAKDPSFFVDCLKVVFRPRNQSSENNDSLEDDEGSNKTKAQNLEAERAKRIWRLLQDWRIIPGSDENGCISLEELCSWMTRARELAQQSHRIEVCDLTIGELFAKSPIEADGAIPLVAIREIIEEVASEDLQRGFYIGLFNRRGVVTKGVYEGGKKERELAARYKEYARICAKWPLTSAVLRELEDAYLHQARRADEEAESRG